MSYPFHKLRSGGNSRTVCTQSGFWGLDLTGNFGKSLDRSPDAVNLIWNGTGLKVRNGYARLCWKEGGAVNGIYFYGTQLLLHVGTCLYGFENEGADDVPNLLYDRMANAPSQGVIRRQTITCRQCTTAKPSGWRRSVLTGTFLFINDGKNYLFYDGEKVRSIMDPLWGQNVAYFVTQRGAQPEYFSTAPFTVVAKTPDGLTGDVDPRGDNMLSQFRCESFYVDDDAEVERFTLACPYGIYYHYVPAELQIRCSDGLWHTYGGDEDFVLSHMRSLAVLVVPKIQAGRLVTINADGLITGMGTGEYTIANDGMDNIRLTYGVFKEEPKMITTATVQGFYGPTGGEEVLFLGGNSSSPGVDAHSAPNNFFCFYETAIEQLGNQDAPVTGYCLLNDGRLGVLKNDPDDSAVYFRSHKVVNLGKTQAGESYSVDVYPSVPGAAVEGCVSPQSLGVVGNEPCFMTESGLFTVRSVSNELTNLNETVRRSRSVDPLLGPLSSNRMCSICWKGYYLIAFGKIAFITDGKKEADGSFRFLKWQFAHEITSLEKHDGILYLGDVEGNLYKLDEGASDDAGESIQAYWEIPAQEDRSGRKMILRRMWAALSGAPEGTVSVGLIQDYEQSHVSHFSLADLRKGTDIDVEWISLLQQPRLASVVKVILDFSKARNAHFLGFRIIYEKGGMIP